jgi:hypothetical protein
LTQWPLHHWSKHFGPCTVKRSKKFFSQYTVGFMGIKRRRILRGFVKNKLALVTKCTQKSYSRITIFVCTQGAPCVVNKFFFLK